MPCSNQKARKLLKLGKAKIYRYNPFTIQLLYATGETTQPCNVGIDTGAKMIGVAITCGDNVLAKGEIELRQDISGNIQTRSILRKVRRNKKTRYRKARFLNRKRKIGWLSPSVQSKLNSTTLWIDRFCSLVPKPNLSIEVGKFDVAKMINPEISGTDYQNGKAKGYYDIRYYVFARDNYTCQVCKKKNKILQTHHLIYQSKGGSDRADNLITVCTDCHTSENHSVGGILYQWMQKHKKVPQFKEATFMNIVRKRTFSLYPNARITYGSETSPRRKELALDKTHYNDAIAISGIQNICSNYNEYFFYKQFRKKKRSLHEAIPRKGKKVKNTTQKRNNKNVPFRNGTFLNDSVLYCGQIGWVGGFGTGYDVILRDINGKFILAENRTNSFCISMKTAKVLCHNNVWQYTVLPKKIKRYTAPIPPSRKRTKSQSWNQSKVETISATPQNESRNPDSIPLLRSKLYIGY